MKTLYDRGLALRVQRTPKEPGEHGRQYRPTVGTHNPTKWSVEHLVHWTFRGWGVQQTLEIYSTLAEYVHAVMCIVDQQWDSSVK